jgi:20S proteasome subunit alpha 6
LSEATKTYTPLQLSSDAYGSDPMLPPFLTATSPSTLTLLVHLDAEKPNLEAKWVKSGDIQEWLKSMFGRMFWAKGDAADGWEKKIQVLDPDPVRLTFVLNHLFR